MASFTDTNQGYGDVFYGEILGTNDLVTFEGESVRELKEAFVEAVDDYVKTCEK